jgi:RHH-type proline utilization regulon transcriptional repressor/proline dehydrogenase/delta 1-pyrroline-5-carboxylate dehydrogenase
MFSDLTRAATEVGRRINPDYLADEGELIRQLVPRADCGDQRRARITATATGLVQAVRRGRRARSGLDSLLQEYDLSSAEGVALLCLAEALLRIPDADTADLLIADRLQAGDWSRHLVSGEPLFVNASTWALMLTGRLLQPEPAAIRSPVMFLRTLASRLGEPIARAAMRQAMRIIGDQFVMGRGMTEALRRAGRADNDRYRYSFDMLGEAALTAADADRYLAAYHDAIECIARDCPGGGLHLDRPGISVKLTALHPRLEPAQRERVLRELTPRVLALAVAARERDVPLTVDAEEADRLELTLAVFEAVCRSSSIDAWDGFGIAVQAYQRRSPRVIAWLLELGTALGRRIPVRLVKGAYWDTEIKRAQELGLSDYPVFTRKVNTDVCYLACARMLLESRGCLYPQFATHNAHTVAWVMHMAPPAQEFEFQRLHGMGEALYEQVMQDADLPCRVYAPVGPHDDLLPYLVRRLLENGANTSFVNRIVQDEVPVEAIVADPVTEARRVRPVANPAIVRPRDLFQPARRNSLGTNLGDSLVVEQLGSALAEFADTTWTAAPFIAGAAVPGDNTVCTSPAARDERVGDVVLASDELAEQAVTTASAGFPEWDATPVAERAACLRRAADRVEAARAELVALCVREAGRCIPDALSEVRETVDFLRYYAAEGERLMGAGLLLPGPTGERNELRWRGRGVFVCISPWNFPLAIFTGQIAAALVSGNTVVAKPAEQTSLIGWRAVQMLQEAGIPGVALQFLPGDGAGVGSRAVSDRRIAGVAFTGSTETARRINLALARRAGPAATLIAETGGQNALVVDSSALPEQVVQDAVNSAFNSAGQRCSALRVLFLQEEIAPRVIELLCGRMAELRIGDPGELSTDVGPVIDEQARTALLRHRSAMLRRGRLLYECALPESAGRGSYFAPIAVELSDISMLKSEVFGPFLHVVRYPAADFRGVLEAINRTGYGLTCGLHSRIESRAREFSEHMLAGNLYVNRNMIGAVVGVQPFGGRGLSGTGPKAGGPHYLPRFAVEQTLTINTAAIGGNAQLLGGG